MNEISMTLKWLLSEDKKEMRVGSHYDTCIGQGKQIANVLIITLVRLVLNFVSSQEHYLTVLCFCAVDLVHFSF